MKSAHLTVLSALLLGGGSGFGLGCSDCSTSGQGVVDYTEGTVNESRTIYQSGSVDDELLHFPQGRTYALHHGLGARPVTVDIFLSFRDRLTSEGDKNDKTAPNNVAPTAGNQAVIEVWDDEIIQVRNDTCAEFHIRVVAIADPDEVDAAGAAGAAGAPSAD